MFKFFLCLSFLLLLESTAYGAEDGNAANQSGACATWLFAEHRFSTSFQLECINKLSSGALRAINSGALESEIEYQYGNVAMSGDKASAAIVRILVNEREGRTPQFPRISNTIYSAMVMSGQFSDANEERRSKKLNVPGIDIDSMHGMTSPPDHAALYWSFDDASNSLTELSVDLSYGPKLVVYSTPACGVCVVLSKYLASNSKLSAIFHEHAIWIDFPDMHFSHEFYDTWKNEAGHFEIHPVFNRKNWPERRLAAFPYMVFLKDGRRIAEMIGWTDGSPKALEQNLEAIGLK